MHEPYSDRVVPAPSLNPKLRERIHAMVVQARPSWIEAWEEDIVQMAMLRLARALEQKPERSRLHTAYLRRVAYTATLDEIRRHASRPKVQGSLMEMAVEDEMVEPRDPASSVEGLQLADEIRTCVAKLLPNRRAAVLLYLEGHTIAEAAYLLGWSAKRTENLVYRGLADLRRELTSRGLAPSC